MMEMIDDDKDRNGGKNFSNNGRKPSENTDFDYFDTNSGGDTDILSQTSDDSSLSELESGHQLVLKKATTAKKQNGTEKKKHKKVSLHSCVSKPDQEELSCDNSSESDLENSQENSRDYLYQVIKDLGGKVSLAKSLNTDALFKAVAVKLVNHSCMKPTSFKPIQYRANVTQQSLEA